MTCRKAVFLQQQLKVKLIKKLMSICTECVTCFSQVKCDQYWPSRGTETHGLVQVTLLDTVELATYCVRTFALYKVCFFFFAPFPLSIIERKLLWEIKYLKVLLKCVDSTGNNEGWNNSHYHIAVFLFVNLLINMELLFWTKISANEE